MRVHVDSREIMVCVCLVLKEDGRLHDSMKTSEALCTRLSLPRRNLKHDDFIASASHGAACLKHIQHQDVTFFGNTPRNAVKKK